MNIKSAKQLVEEAMMEIKTIKAGQLNNFLTENSNAVLIDVRDIRELKKTGKIKIAKHIPRGMLEFWLDPESPYYKNDISVEQTKILYCASNWRSALATKTLKEMGFNNVLHVEGGFEAIAKAGFEIEKLEK